MLPIPRTRSATAPRALVMLLAITMLMGADSCPLTTDPPDATGTSTLTGLDIGGASGALWAVGFESQVRVTLRSGTQSDSTSTNPAQDGVISVLGRTVDLSSFCWRVDVVCPQQVLASQTPIVQSTTTNQFVVGYISKGPLSGITERGLLGTLNGAELSVPLAMAPATGDPCTLGASSAIEATASAPSGSDLADTINGMVTLRYSGECVTLGGNGALYDTDVVELGVRFSASRQQ